MPGVPSGKGCEGCRKQKKKCDQGKPACSRCVRRQIPCVGSGQQRYKFVKRQSRGIRVPAVPEERNAVVWTPPSTPPTNDSTSTITMLVSALEVTDLRYSLSCYGDFLSHVPSRIGKSDALDASVKALVTTLPYQYNGQMPPGALVSYVDALKTLRLCLNDSKKALTVETLCAIYLIMICQGWIERSDDTLKSHGEILAHLMSSKSVREWRDSFELDLLRTLCVPVLLEAIANPAFSLNSWFMKLIKTCGPPKPTNQSPEVHVPSIHIQKLARLPELLAHPDIHLNQIETMYRDMCEDHPRLRQFIILAGEEMASGTIQTDPTYVNKLRYFHRSQVVFGVLLTFILSLNSLLRALDPSDSDLIEQSKVYAIEVLALARQASRQRPLGASFIPPCLAAVWATADDKWIRSGAERLIAEYQPDYPQTQWMEHAIWLKSVLKSSRTQLSKTALANSLVGSHGIQTSSVVYNKASFSRHNKAAFGQSGASLFS